MFKVQKRNGELEDFQKSKVSEAAVKAGATPDQAEMIAAQVENWIPKVAINEVISSQDIKSKVLEILDNINPIVATNFRNFTKPVSE